MSNPIEEPEATITYSEALEDLLGAEAERCVGLAWLHAKSEIYFNKLNSSIVIPTIILSTVVGFLSSTSSSLFTNQTSASVGIGAVSLFSGMLNSIGSYFGYAKRAEGHRIGAIQYTKLGRFLTIELALPKNERISADALLKLCKQDIERLLEISPIIPDAIIKQYKTQFKNYTDIAHPLITNGLHKVEINHRFEASPPPV